MEVSSLTAPLDVARIKKDFPILERVVHGKRLVYLDTASSSQKPLAVIEAMSRYYETTHANVHRGVYEIAQEATRLYEEARAKVAGFIGASSPDEVVFTKNATEAINLVAYSWGRKNIGPGDVVVTTEIEHHANFVPWLQLREETGPSSVSYASATTARSTWTTSSSSSTAPSCWLSRALLTCSGPSPRCALW